MGDEAPAPQWSFEAHQGWVRTAAVSPDGELLATGGNDNCVRLWSTADGRLRRELGHDCHVYNTAFDPTGEHFVSADHKGIVKHWDPATGRLVRTLDAGLLYKYDTGFHAGCGGARGMAFSPDGRYLACSGITDVTNAFAGVGNAVVVLFDWLTGQQKAVLRPKEDFQGVAWDVAFHPDGFLIAVGGGGGGGALWFWHPPDERSFHTLKLPNNGRGFDLHPAGRLLAVAHADTTLRLYEMAAKPGEG
jgi:WD40 repeat protein